MDDKLSFETVDSAEAPAYPLHIWEGLKPTRRLNIANGILVIEESCPIYGIASGIAFCLGGGGKR